jgi:hypothetical protein
MQQLRYIDIPLAQHVSGNFLPIFEQHPPQRTHSLRLGSPDQSPAAKLVAENQKL